MKTYVTEIAVQSFTSKIGSTEDGPAYADFLVVVAYAADGTGYAHTLNFPTAEIAHCDADPSIAYVRPINDAEARAQALADRVTARGWLDADHWREWYPRYGSPAYEAKIEAERVACWHE